MFTLATPKHEEVAIYAVNQRIPNVCRIVYKIVIQRILYMYEIIFNPNSRSNNGCSVCDTITKYMKDNNIDYILHKTKRAGHAKNIAHEITSDGLPHTIIVIGGDGTLNEVINGLFNPELITMGLIPSGSGNDFARSCGISTIPLEALNIILNETNLASINYGEVFMPGCHRRFLISCGCGFDSEVCRDAQISPLKPILNKLHIGKFIYTLIAIKKLIRKSTFSAKLLIDNETKINLDKLFFLTAMNSRYEGGGYMFAPDASLLDNKLDFLTVNNLTRKRIISLLPKAKKGKHVGYKGIDIVPISEVGMKFSKSVSLHTDGEVLGAFDHVRIVCADKHIKFYMPDNSSINRT